MIPVLSVNEKTIAAAWEQSLYVLYNNGVKIKTQYDKPEDPPSIDSTMIITVQNPLEDPMIHRDFPGGLEDLQEYVMEVLDGIKDHWVRDPNNPNDTRWEYTYHARLTSYDGLNQLDNMVQQLAKTPYTRRAQAITWKVKEDNDCYDPPCMQSIWARITDDYLNMNVRFRSNDAYKAAFMNIYAFVGLQERLAWQLSEMMGREIKVGRYCHMADSYHIYGSVLEEFKGRFLKSLETRTFEQRTFKHEQVRDIMLEAIPNIKKKIANKDG
jgi:thymidylate synthase